MQKSLPDVIMERTSKKNPHWARPTRQSVWPKIQDLQEPKSTNPPESSMTIHDPTLSYLSNPLRFGGKVGTVAARFFPSTCSLHSPLQKWARSCMFRLGSCSHQTEGVGVGQTNLRDTRQIHHPRFFPRSSKAPVHPGWCLMSPRIELPLSPSKPDLLFPPWSHQKPTCRRSHPGLHRSIKVSRCLFSLCRTGFIQTVSQNALNFKNTLCKCGGVSSVEKIPTNGKQRLEGLKHVSIKRYGVLFYHTTATCNLHHWPLQLLQVGKARRNGLGDATCSWP